MDSPEDEGSAVGMDNGQSHVTKIFDFLRTILGEFFPWLFSMDILKNSIYLASESLKESPASTLFYGMIAVLGFLPLMGFFVLVSSTAVLFSAFFIFCQLMVVLTGALIFTALFWWVIALCCATAFCGGAAIHSLYGFGWVTRNSWWIFRGFSIKALQILGVPESEWPEKLQRQNNDAELRD